MARKPSEFVDHPAEFPDRPEYRAFCRHVVDADTFDFIIDLGMNNYAYEVVRLADVDTPEIFRPKSDGERRAGNAAKEFVEQRLLNRYCRLFTRKDKATFGRYVADVQYWDSTRNAFIDIGVELKQAGHEKRESYDD